MKKQYKILIFASLIIMVIACDRHFGCSEYLRNTENLAFLNQMVKENLPAAVAIYTIFTIIGCVVLALPGITFAVLAGMMLGPWLGILACLFATTLGACIAFIAGRFFLRESIKPLLEKNRMLKKLLFSENEKNIIEFNGIMSNPTYSKVQEGAKLAKENEVDFIIAVGGGSVIDCCKIV